MANASTDMPRRPACSNSKTATGFQRNCPKLHDRRFIVAIAMSKRSVAKASRDWCDTDGTGDRQGAWGLGGAAGKAVAYVGTLLLLFLCPGTVIYLWFTLTKLDGSLAQVYEYARSSGLYGLYYAWPRPTLEAWKVITVFGLFEAALQLYLPGKEFKGPVSPKGNTPVYKANGVQSYLVTLSLFLLSWWFQLFNPAHIYDIFGEILATLNIFSLLLCTFLYFKGRYNPSSSDNGSTGSIVYDFFWGRELYPRIGKNFDIKTWTNCRMGLMSWAILPLCFAAKQLEATGSISNSMIVCVALKELYVFKFFHWETGYWRTMDIAHDRAGYYICWGCLNWVPCLYTSQPLFLTTHPYKLHPLLAAAIFVAGAACIYINWDADRQRQVFRESEGTALVWGKKPKIVVAKYKSKDGHESASLLLASGYWGLSRHFHYIPEILAAVFWTAPAGFSHPLVWFYVIFLTLLLTDRSYRDDQRCSSKYGSYWDLYCKAVPYRMIPYVF